MRNCESCGRELNQPGRPDTDNHDGGTCVRCCAEEGDPDAIDIMDEFDPDWEADDINGYEDEGA